MEDVFSFFLRYERCAKALMKEIKGVDAVPTSICTAACLHDALDPKRSLHTALRLQPHRRLIAHNIETSL
ncbi:MAG: hypothetical protein ACLVJ6_07570 [Merdibacter sp.]